MTEEQVRDLHRYRDRLNWWFGLGSEGFSEGSYCPVPERSGEAALQPRTAGSSR